MHFKVEVTSGEKICKRIGEWKRGGLLYQAYFLLFFKKRCEADIAKCYHLLNTASECRLLFSIIFSVLEEFQI